MSRIPSTGLAAAAPSSSKTRGNDLREVDVDQFLQLMIAELQNQDPLNPLDNSQLLQQISQIREIGATNQLTETLNSVLLGQNLATASSLIGREVEALTDDAQSIKGLVDRVSVDANDENQKRTFKVHIGEHDIQLNNIRSITSSDG